jgi:hypothetical protein
MTSAVAHISQAMSGVLSRVTGYTILEFHVSL